MPNFSQIIFPISGLPGSKEVRVAAPYVAQIWALLEDLSVHYTGLKNTIVEKYGGIKYIVDEGACIGTMAIPYARAFPSAKILAIEPSRYNYGFLQFNCRDFPNIETLKIAAHNKKGIIQIASPNESQRPSRADGNINTGLISVYGDSEFFREEVVADTLDNIVDGKVDWLKLDVEGHEQAVLEGATRILSEDRPILQIEMSEENQSMGPYTLSSLLETIGGADYISVSKMRGDLVFAPKGKIK